MKNLKRLFILVMLISLAMGAMFVINAETEDSTVKINFQTSHSQTPDGFLADSGEVYDDRGNGFTFGWNINNSGNARDYSLIESDLKLATLTQFGQGYIWEIAVPNGTYQVTVSLGDIQYPDQIKGKLLLTAEDIVLFENEQVDGVWQHVKPNGQTYVSNTIEVEVTDGKLTLDPHDSAAKNIKMNYIEITALSGPIVPTEPVETDEVKVNFQTQASQIPEGFVADNGEVYDSRGNGFTYGWNINNSGNARDYSTLEPDLRLATLTQFGQGYIWEMAVPNGTYEVTVSLGDIQYPDQIKGKLLLTAEDIVLFENEQVDGAWQHVKPDGQTYVSNTVQVEVTDGNLTLDPHDSAAKNIKMNYIEIKALTTPIPIEPTDPGNNEPPPVIDPTPITLIIDGVPAVPTVSPVRANGHVMIPVSVVTDSFDADFAYDEDKDAVLINSLSGQARLEQQSTQLIVNGLGINPAVPPLLLDGNWMLPAQEIAEMMGMDVTWDEATLTMEIDLPAHTAPSSDLYGWAAVHADGVNGTTGGGNAAPITVTTRAELAAAAGDDIPKVIIVSGTISSGVHPIPIGSNKTIVGEDKYATIHGGITINNSENIIIRNLNFQGYWPVFGPSDTIAVRNSHHLWFDHLNIWDASDGLLDLTQGTNYVTISWSKFFYTESSHPHRLASLNGGGAEHEDTDMGKNKVTYHHNWFANNVDQRMPRVLFGQAHAFNNYYTASDNNYAIGVGVYASMLIENNYFKNVRNPHQFMYPDRRPAYITASGNVYDNTSGKMETGAATPDGYNSVSPFTNPPYTYTLDDAADVPFLVTRYAGPQ